VTRTYTNFSKLNISSPSYCHLLAALGKKNVAGYTFKEDREVDTGVAQWLVTQDRDFCEE
jgi:hypothetical protein